MPAPLSLKFVSLVAVAGLSLTATAVQDGIVMRRIAKVGDVAKYRMNAEIPIKGSPASYSALLTEKVTKVGADGQFAITTGLSETKLTYGGNVVPGSSGDQGTVQTTFKSTGEVVAVIGDISDPNAFRMANLQSIVFPATPIKVGSTWEITIKKDERGAVDATGTYKVDGEEKIGPYDTYKIHETLKELIAKDPASVDATYWINKADGTTAKMVGTWTSAPFPPPLGAADAKVTVTREG